MQPVSQWERCLAEYAATKTWPAAMTSDTAMNLAAWLAKRRLHHLIPSLTQISAANGYNPSTWKHLVASSAPHVAPADAVETLLRSPNATDAASATAVMARLSKDALKPQTTTTFSHGVSSARPHQAAWHSALELHAALQRINATSSTRSSEAQQPAKYSPSPAYEAVLARALIDPAVPSEALEAAATQISGDVMDFIQIARAQRKAQESMNRRMKNGKKKRGSRRMSSRSDVVGSEWEEGLRLFENLPQRAPFLQPAVAMLPASNPQRWNLALQMLEREGLGSTAHAVDMLTMQGNWKKAMALVEKRGSGVVQGGCGSLLVRELEQAGATEFANKVRKLLQDDVLSVENRRAARRLTGKQDAAQEGDAARALELLSIATSWTDSLRLFNYAVGSNNNASSSGALEADHIVEVTKPLLLAGKFDKLAELYNRGITLPRRAAAKRRVARRLAKNWASGVASLKRLNDVTNLHEAQEMLRESFAATQQESAAPLALSTIPAQGRRRLLRRVSTHIFDSPQVNAFAKARAVAVMVETGCRLPADVAHKCAAIPSLYRMVTRQHSAAEQKIVEAIEEDFAGMGSIEEVKQRYEFMLSAQLRSDVTAKALASPAPGYNASPSVDSIPGSSGLGPVQEQFALGALISGDVPRLTMVSKSHDSGALPSVVRSLPRRWRGTIARDVLFGSVSRSRGDQRTMRCGVPAWEWGLWALESRPRLAATAGTVPREVIISQPRAAWRREARSLASTVINRLRDSNALAAAWSPQFQRAAVVGAKHLDTAAVDAVLEVLESTNSWKDAVALMQNCKAASQAQVFAVCRLAAKAALQDSLRREAANSPEMGEDDLQRCFEGLKVSKCVKDFAVVCASMCGKANTSSTTGNQSTADGGIDPMCCAALRAVWRLWHADDPSTTQVAEAFAASKGADLSEARGVAGMSTAGLVGGASSGAARSRFLQRRSQVLALAANLDHKSGSGGGAFADVMFTLANHSSDPSRVNRQVARLMESEGHAAFGE